MIRSFASTVALAAIVGLAASDGFAADAGSMTQQNADQWRASKLVGVTIYGPDNQNVGKISDIIMTKDGKAVAVIVGVGGFLGIGEKDVAVPYDQVKFTEQPLTPPANPAPVAQNTTMAPGAANPGAAPGTSAVPMGAAPMGATTMAAPPSHSTAYPDHGTIDMTKDQLKNAPGFKFAS